MIQIKAYRPKRPQHAPNATQREADMGLMSKLDASADLVQGMATRVGHDLTRDPMAFRSMVLRCSGCAEQGECASLQATSVTLAAPPVYCRNAQTLRS